MIQPPRSDDRRPMARWALRRRYEIRHLPAYIIGGVLHLLSFFLRLHPNTMRLMRRALELGNPTQSVWPSETIPMVSRLIAGGFWNYSFFQFHRHFLFPYWAHRQYNPKESSFIPRSHNVLSMNQTHRNWVSISFPGKSEEISVDFAGAIMPGYDWYTIEMAILDEDEILRPHTEPDSLQILVPGLSRMTLQWRGRRLHLEARQSGLLIRGEGDSHLVLAVRPFNMEGPAHIYNLECASHRGLLGDVRVDFSKAPDLFQLSDLEWGDSLTEIPRLAKRKATKGEGSTLFRLRRRRSGHIRTNIWDPMGMITGSFLYNHASDVHWFVHDRRTFRVPAKLVRGLDRKDFQEYEAADIWQKWFPEMLEMQVPEPYQSRFDLAKRHLLTLWDFDTITPGSFTYHHFWIRDAVVMMNALLLTGGHRAVREIILTFDRKVSWDGRFESQAGEYDANGQALWILGRYAAVTGDMSLLLRLRKPISRMLHWIDRKTRRHSGVLPPGFSAEHLGVADWYLWDNFWTLGGLREIRGYSQFFEEGIVDRLYDRIHAALNQYLKDYDYYPAALGRKRDAGMIGSVAAVYPCLLPEYFDQRMDNTLGILVSDYFFKGGFFQENIHSGVNPYLTLQVAESYLALGNASRAWEIFDRIHRWAGKANTFPEAVHPKTGGGCMGDGFHGWAFAEIIIFLRHVFLLELQNRIIIAHGMTEDQFSRNWTCESLLSAAGNLRISIQNRKLMVSGLEPGSYEYLYVSLPRSVRVRFHGNNIAEHEKLSAADLGIFASGASRVFHRLRIHGDSFSCDLRF